MYAARILVGKLQRNILSILSIVQVSLNLTHNLLLSSGCIYVHFTHKNFLFIAIQKRSNSVITGKVKSSPTGHVGPEGSRRVKAPSFRDVTVMVVGCQPYAPAAFTPRSIPDDRNHTWYSFLLEAESTPGP